LQVLTGQPFDIVKVRMQNQSSRHPRYNNPIHCVRSIYVHEGLRAFYNGTLAPLSVVAFTTSIQFGLNELFKRLTLKYHQDHQHTENPQLRVRDYISCGALVGVGIAFVAAPAEHIRIQLQKKRVNALESYTGSYDALRKIYSRHGINGVYRGLGITLVRDINAFGIFFGVYESL